MLWIVCRRRSHSIQQMSRWRNIYPAFPNQGAVKDVVLNVTRAFLFLAGCLPNGHGPTSCPERGVQARRVGQTKSDAKRQHIKGWEDGRKRTGPASADPVWKAWNVERYAALAFLTAVGFVWLRLGLRGRLLGGLRLLFRGKLRFDLLGDGVGVHFVMLGGVFERLAGLRLRPG